MKKKLCFLLSLCFILPMAFVLGACCDKPYTVNLTKTLTQNCFEIKVTDDFSLSLPDDNSYIASKQYIALESEGDDEVYYFGATISGQVDYGNEFYSFENTSLQTYIHDMKVGLDDKNFDAITINEKVGDEKQELQARFYMICRNTNPDGNWDYYDTFLFAKGQYAFVYFKFSTECEKALLGNLTTKFKTIAETIVVDTQVDKSYNQDVEQEMSNPLVSTADGLEAFGIRMNIPNDFKLMVNPAGNHYNYLTTNYDISGDSRSWNSNILFSSLGGFMGEYTADPRGARNLFKYTSANLSAFYVKLAGQNGFSYNFYFYDENDSLTQYLMAINVSCTQELQEKGFLNYFEKQMLTWVHNLECI